jgi:hypothetical protein
MPIQIPTWPIWPTAPDELARGGVVDPHGDLSRRAPVAGVKVERVGVPGQEREPYRAGYATEIVGLRAVLKDMISRLDRALL